MNTNPLYLVRNITSFKVFSCWVSWLKCFWLDKKNLVWPSFVLFIGQYVSCLICPQIHIFIHQSICSALCVCVCVCVYVCVCVCVRVYAPCTVTENLCTLNSSQMIGYLFSILPSYMLSTDGFETKRAKEKQLRILFQMSTLWHA